jgi:ATP-dependent DNA helicase RecG
VVPTLDQLRVWLSARENEHLEFKEAKGGFHFEKLAKYCAALANEGGGSIVLGVTDRRPRRVVGSSAFENLERTKAGLVERLRLKVEATELPHADGRVVVFTVPSRPLGVPISVEGAYWMRAGEDIVPMTADMLREIFDENCPDFSAEICSGATLPDLDPAAIDEFRRRWHLASGQSSVLQCPTAQLLRDAELISGRGVTYAALVLLGSSAALSRYLGCAEIVFEYRSSEAPGPANQREEFRCAFLLAYDRVWELADLRNDKQHYLYRLVMFPLPTFAELSVREALLNAVAHRDYRHPGSIFVRQYSRRIEVVSPGGFPKGITLQNILYRQEPRNRRLADAFARCGLVERAGQGTDRIYEECLRQGKQLPDFTHTDAYQVSLTLHGEIADDGFLQFMHRLADEGLGTTSTQDLLVFDCVRHGRRVPKQLRPWLQKLVKRGVLESVGSGRATTYAFSSRLSYALSGGVRRGARPHKSDRARNKELLLRHINANAAKGARFEELREVVPADLSRDQIQTLLRELKEQGVIAAEGTTRSSRWYPLASKTQSDAIGPIDSAEKSKT